MTNQQAPLLERIDTLEKENWALRESLRSADLASRAKSEFLAMVSHEIRTPMNGVIGLTELLLGTELTDKQRHYAGLIASSASNLLSLINSFLDFSKIEAEKVTIQKRPFSLRELLNELTSLFQVTAELRGITISSSIDNHLGAWYSGDNQRLRQVLVNLLGNAIKFSDQGEIQVAVSFDGKEEENDWLRFEVSDQGPGIEGQQQELIFQPFYQADQKSTREHGGTGLGLPISLRLVELMGGKIGVHSEPGKGSTFWFRVPLQRTRARETTSGKNSSPSSHASAMESGHDIRLLVVDDEKINRLLMQEMLEKNGLQITTASNGEQALQQCAITDYDMIFMDCQMPQMDGFAATQAIIRQAEHMGREAPVIVALTADITSTTRERCQTAGMADYMTKPLDPAILHNILTRWLPEVQLTGPLSSQQDLTSGDAGEDHLHQIDQERLQRLRDNVGDIRPIIKAFVDALPRRVAALEESARSGDRETLFQAAHQLKGSSRQLGADYLAERCQQVETMTRENNLRHLDVVTGQIKRSSVLVTEILNSLQA